VGNGLDLGGEPAMLPASKSAPKPDPTGTSDRMPRLTYAIAAGVLAAACLGVVAYAQQPAPPPFATTKVDGTENVYVFRYGNHQSMFVVTSAGVIATDPIGYGRPQAVVTYVDEIKKVSSQPIKYLVYSHHHFDHIAGGKPFKDAGATIIAHKRAKEQLAVLKDPHTVLPTRRSTPIARSRSVTRRSS
jgi:glyoxylase-like metal-dependent hydrolase (beta-lactamase superfamily II)